MSKKDFILFYPGYAYESNPIFFSLTPYFREYKTVYCNTNNPITLNANKGMIDKKQIQQYFDYFVEIKNPFEAKYSIVIKAILLFFKVISLNIFTEFIFYWKYKRDLFHLLNQLKPKAVFSVTDNYFIDGVVISWCVKNKVPFNIFQTARLDRFYLKTGIPKRAGYFFWNKILKLPINLKPIVFYGNVDPRTYLFLWSKLSDANPTRGNTYYLGNPALDIIFEHFSPKRVLKNNAVICTQPLYNLYGQEEFNEVCKIFGEAIRSKPSYTFFVKVHPRESKALYEKIFSQEEYPNVKVVKNVKLSDVYKRSDFEISVMSTTLFEAVSQGVPVITINPENRLYFTPYFRDFISIHVKRASDIKKGMETILSKEFWDDFIEKRDKFLRMIYTYTDGKTAMRIATEIKKLIIS